jgi:hypothetical protein
MRMRLRYDNQYGGEDVSDDLWTNSDFDFYLHR